MILFSSRGVPFYGSCASSGIHFGPTNRERDREREIRERVRAVTIRRRTSCFFFFSTIRRTAYVQRTNGGSCACVEYLTGLNPIHTYDTRRITLNGEAAARGSPLLENKSRQARVHI